jgi:mRNA interferase MazF
MRRGEIRVVDLAPVRGTEADKRRPAVIVSNDGANTTAERLGRGVVAVVAVAAHVGRVVPVPVLVRPGGPRRRRAGGGPAPPAPRCR